MSRIFSLAEGEVNYSTSASPASTLTKEKLAEAVALIKELRKDPFEAYANKYGFSLDAGDFLIVPIDIKEELLKGGPLHPNVRFSEWVKEVFLIRSPSKLWARDWSNIAVRETGQENSEPPEEKP